MEEKQRSGIIMAKKKEEIKQVDLPSLVRDQDKSMKDLNHKWKDTNVKKRHLKKSGNANKNIFSRPDTTKKLFLIVCGVAKKIRDIGKEYDENDNG